MLNGQPTLSVTNDECSIIKFREEGFPIGSGTVESGVKQFKQRFCATGMRWEEANTNRMVVIRAAVLSNQFDALWKNAPLH
jgi:hypothetical protein